MYYSDYWSSAAQVSSSLFELRSYMSLCSHRIGSQATSGPFLTFLRSLILEYVTTDYYIRVNDDGLRLK